VEGAFTGDAPVWKPETNKLVSNIVSSKDLRETLKETPVKVIGMAPEQAVIASLTDVVSGRVNEVLTPGGMANIRGNRIKIIGDKPGLGLFFTNQDTQEVVQVPDTAIGVNDPSKLIFIIPPDLPVGNYLLSIVTQFTGSNGRFLHDPRTISFNQLLAVE
jgi:multidrug efflux pump subunit AcrA (membrane-fusion protein)